MSPVVNQKTQQIPDLIEGSLSLPIPTGNNSDNKWTITGTAILPNLHLPILETPNTSPLMMQVNIALG